MKVYELSYFLCQSFSTEYKYSDIVMVRSWQCLDTPLDRSSNALYISESLPESFCVYQVSSLIPTISKNWSTGAHPAGQVNNSKR